MFGGMFGGTGAGDPDVIVESDENGWWSARGPKATRNEQGRTLERVLEVVARGRDGSDLVEVRDGRSVWTATAREIADDYGVEYRDPSPVTFEDEEDPFYEYL